MPSIAIVTDTDSGLPIQLSEKYKIKQVPIVIQFGDDTYQDVFGISNEDLFSRINKEKKLPTTAAPSPGLFFDVFTRVFQDGADEVLCLNISSEMSATYSSAIQAANMLPEKKITVVDTRSLSIGEGYMVLAAAEAIAQGASIENAILHAEDVRSRTYLFGALSTLRYIAMSGRVSHLAANMAGLLNIKPLLTAQNGKLELLEKVRTQNKSWERLIELTMEKAAGRKIERMSILNVTAAKDARFFENQIRSAISCPTIIDFIDVNPGLAIHTGAGMVAVGFVIAKD